MLLNSEKKAANARGATPGFQARYSALPHASGEEYVRACKFWGNETFGGVYPCPAQESMPGEDWDKRANGYSLTAEIAKTDKYDSVAS